MVASAFRPTWGKRNPNYPIGMSYVNLSIEDASSVCFLAALQQNFSMHPSAMMENAHRPFPAECQTRRLLCLPIADHAYRALLLISVLARWNVLESSHSKVLSSGRNRRIVWEAIVGGIT